MGCLVRAFEEANFEVRPEKLEGFPHAKHKDDFFEEQETRKKKVKTITQDLKTLAAQRLVHK